MCHAFSSHRKSHQFSTNFWFLFIYLFNSFTNLRFFSYKFSLFLVLKHDYYFRKKMCNTCCFCSSNNFFLLFLLDELSNTHRFCLWRHFIHSSVCTIYVSLHVEGYFLSLYALMLLLLLLMLYHEICTMQKHAHLSENHLCQMLCTVLLVHCITITITTTPVHQMNKFNVFKHYFHSAFL